MKGSKMLRKTITITAVFFLLTAGVEVNGARARNYLHSLMPNRELVEHFTKGKQDPNTPRHGDGYTFDGQLGWVCRKAVLGRSVDGSKGFYTYESDGARKVINSADKPWRIHTYGDSFTHCDQVSDGESWQEYLASHLQEPVRNYGVGGYSVYQAYLRMLRTEKQNPAKYIILNIYDDDHLRNLDAWRMIRFGPEPRSQCGWTLPHLRVNVQKQTCQPIANILSRPEDVYKLCDEQFVWETFKNDPVLRLVLAARAGGKMSQRLVEPAAVSFGIPDEIIADTKMSEQLRKIHTEAALYATKNIITWTEQFAKRTGKKLMIMLSFGRRNMAAALHGKPRFDKSFTDWLKDKPYPVIDMRDAFAREYAQFNVEPETYLDRYYNGHHTPLGNFFTAWAIKKHVVEWLEPKPLPYR
jgi:hypothetical protein